MKNIAIIQHNNNPRKYLFALPDDASLKAGDRVRCDTKRGVTEGVAFADSVWVDENIAELIGKLTGATLPLKSVVGKMEYVPFSPDKPEPKFKVGDKVKAVNDGERYGTYTDWFEEQSVDRSISCRFDYDSATDLRDGDMLTVLASGAHCHDPVTVYAAEKTPGGEVFLIGENGLELWEDPAPQKTMEELVDECCNYDGHCDYDECEDNCWNDRNGDCPLLYIGSGYSTCPEYAAAHPELRPTLEAYLAAQKVEG